MVVAELLTRLGFEVDPRELNRGIDKAKSSLSGLKSFLGKLALGYTFYEVGAHVLKTARYLETMSVQLETFTGSAASMQKLFRGIVDYAKQTHFYVADISQAVVKMSQGGVPTEAIMPKIKQLGDISSSGPQLKALGFTYGRIYSHGFMSGQELLMMQRSGNFAPLMQLARKQAEAAGLMKKGDEVAAGSKTEKFIQSRMAVLRDMVKHQQFTIQMLNEAIDYSTSKGGMYFEHQAKQVKTFEGAWTNMIDVLQINAALALQKLFPLFKKLMIAVTEIPFDWLERGFTGIAAALNYIWMILVDEGLVEEFFYLRDALASAASAWVEVLTGIRGGGDTLRNVAVVAGVLLTRLMMMAEVVLWFGTMFGHMATGVRFVIDAVAYITKAFENLVGAGWAFFSMILVLGPPIGYALYSMWASGTLGSLGFIKAIQKVSVALRSFAGLSMLQLGFVGAAIAVLSYDAYILGKTLKENENLAASVDRETRKAAIAQSIMEVGELRVKARKEGRSADVERYTRGIDDLWTRYHAIGDEGKSGFDKEYDSLLKGMGKTLQEMKDLQKQGNGTLGQIAGNTAPKGTVPNDVLRLAEMSFRTRFVINGEAERIALAAE